MQMASMLELAGLWRKAGGRAIGFSPINPQPFALFLKLVTSHADPLAHAFKLPGTVDVDELIGLSGFAMLAICTGHTVIIQKQIGCNGCNRCNLLLNLSIWVFYVFICHISLFPILSKVDTPGCTRLHKANSHAGFKPVQPRCNLPFGCNVSRKQRVQPVFSSDHATGDGCTLYFSANRSQCASHPTD